MRPRLSDLSSVALTLAAVVLPTLGVQAQTKSAGEGDLHERREIHRTYHLVQGSSVDVSTIAGPVEIETTNDDTAQVDIIESAQTRHDLDCYKTLVEHTPTSLVIRHEQSCSNVNDHQRVKLTLPRSISVSLNSIAGSAQVGAIDGLLRLDSIAGKVVLEQVHAAEILSLANGLTIGLTQPRRAGNTDQQYYGRSGALLTSRLALTPGATINLIGEVVNEAPDVSVTKRSPGFQIVIGSGGRANSLSSISGGIRIRRL